MAVVGEITDKPLDLLAASGRVGTEGRSSRKGGGGTRKVEEQPHALER